MLPLWINRLPDARVPVLFEDAHLLIVGKPAGAFLPGQPVVCGTDFSELLLHHEVITPRDRSVFKPVNRLAAVESGMVIYGKTGLAAATMDRLFRETPVQQTWWAVVEGKYKPKGVKPGPKRGSDRGKEVRTPNRNARIEAVEVWGKGERQTLVRVSAFGGAKLDMRAYFRARFHPVVGDRRGHLDTGEIFAGRCFLHLAELAFVHPMTHKGVKVRLPHPRSFADLANDGDLIEDALSVALVVRAATLGNPETSAFRLLNGGPDGVRGLTVEQYGHSIVMWTQPEKFKSEAKRLSRAARFYQRILNADEVIHKTSFKDRGASSDDEFSSPSQILIGDAPDPQPVITENGLKYGVRLKEGLGTGLFLDQRDNRQRLREMAAGKRVLNTFAHTCGFSLAAAAGGAAQTVSVDISNTYLEWGKQNFELNGLMAPQHEFVREEVFDYLQRAARLDRRFDIVILDPPTFARSKRPKRVFSLSADLPNLVRLGLGVLAPHGVMLININSRSHSPRFLRDAVKTGAAERRIRIVSTPRLPPDFASDPRHSKCLWLQIEGPIENRPKRFVGDYDEEVAKVELPTVD